MSTLNGLAGKIHAENIQRGYWDNGVELHKKLLLITSEVVEFMEAERKGKSLKYKTIHEIHSISSDDAFLSQFNEFVKGTQEEEGADILLRTLDLLSALSFDIDGIVAAKRRYNELKGRDPLKAY